LLGLCENLIYYCVNGVIWFFVMSAMSCGLCPQRIKNKIKY